MQNKKIFLPLIILAGLLIVVLIMMVMPEERFVFNFKDNVGQWQTSPGTKVRADDDAIALRRANNNFIVVMPKINLGAENYDVAIIDMKQPVAHGGGRLFFISPYNQRFQHNFSLPFDTGGADKFNRIYIDLKRHPAWKGIIRALLIVPATNSDKMSLKSITFVQSNPWTKLRAWMSDFTRHYDPKLGTCFAMASPIFLGKTFNMWFIPILWWLLAIVLLILVIDHFSEIDPRIKRYSILVFFIIFLMLWGVLDLRNNVYYLKAMRRNANLYWGKTLWEKKGINAGDKEYIKFMRFCDENIPKEGWIYNFVPWELPGTASRYLSTTQFYYNMRPDFKRLFRKLEMEPKPYYVYYKPKDKKIKTLSQEQAVLSTSVDILPGEELLQGIRLWRDLKNLEQVSFISKSDEKAGVSILDEKRDKVIAKGKYLKKEKDRVFYEIVPIKKYGRNNPAYIRIANRGERPIDIGISYSTEYDEGNSIIKGKKDNRDLTFRLDYNTKGLKVFKKYNEEAFILTE